MFYGVEMCDRRVGESRERFCVKAFRFLDFLNFDLLDREVELFKYLSMVSSMTTRQQEA